ncbi:MAG TPA: hypothetical protein VNH83_28110 [Bryobacteraceae bacterium]|nr:hypothetical protein [Bryobacteraceae bacterium]
MRNELSAAIEPVEAAAPADDSELDRVLLAHPWLKGLEPFYIEWELVWPM